MLLEETQSEVIVTMPIVNPRTGWRSRSFSWAGKIDELNPSKVIDYKSASDPGLYLWRETLSFQPEMYALGAKHMFDVDVTEVEYRIVKTPGIKLCSKDSSVLAYENRVLEWLQEKPDGVTTCTLLVSRARLEAARRYLWVCSKRVLQCRNDGVWLPNRSACNDWNRECAFKPLCECLADGGCWQDLVDIGDYRVVDNIHPELAEYDKDLGLLTHSSTGVLTNCEQRYEWIFEHCLRKGEEPIDARWLGSAMHAGLDAYAKDGKEAAFKAIEEWAQENPILGPDAAHKRDQEVARARAMVRAAWEKWN